MNFREKHNLTPSQIYIETESKSLKCNYTKLLEKLNSIGPLSIPNLDKFLYKAKLDFKHSYKDKSIDNLKISDFVVMEQVGCGSFGHVVLARRKNNVKDSDLYAIKVIEKRKVIQEKHFQYVHNEKRVLQSLNFPFVIHLKFFFVDFNFLYFALPFVPGDFFEFLQECKPLLEDHAKFYTCQLVLALEYLHYLELIHRDMKPENIMLDYTGYIKLCDFGHCCKLLKNTKAWTIAGTTEYMAPEIIKCEGYDFSVDWWSLGVTLYEMCAGSRPFADPSQSKLEKLVIEGNYSLPSRFSSQLKSLIKNLLKKSPKNRVGGKNRGAKEVKKQKWFKKTDWLALLNRTLPAPYVPRQISYKK